MDLDSLRCFDAAATTLNFRAASRRVHLSPAAFSDRIRRLEEQLAVSLFTRSTRQVELSDEGRRLLPLAREALAGIERVESAARAPDQRSPYVLYVGTRYELGLSWLCPAIKPLMQHRPERTIHLHNGDGPDLLLKLERGDLDAIVASIRLTSPRLTYAALHSEDYALVSSTPGVRGRDTVGDRTLVDISSDLPLFRYFLDALPDAEPWPFGSVEYMGGIGNIRRRLLDRPRGIAVLPTYFIRRDLEAGRFVRLMPRIKLRTDAFRLVWKTGHPRSAELIALAGELRRLPLC